MVIREQALRTSREQVVPYLTSRGDKTSVEIKLWASPKFVPSPCPSDKEHPWKLGQGGIYVWNVACGECCWLYAKTKPSNLLRIHVFVVVVLMSDLWSNFGLNFRTTISVASCSFGAISLFCPPLLHSCDSRLSEVLMCCPIFSWWWVVLEMSSSFPWLYLCVFWNLMSWFVQTQDWLAVLLVSGCFSTFALFFRVSPFPTFPSRILVPAACWQGRRQCGLRCVL